MIEVLGETALTWGWWINIVERVILAPAWMLTAVVLWRLRGIAVSQNGAQSDSVINALTLAAVIATVYAPFSVFLAVRTWRGNLELWLWVSGWIIAPVTVAVMLMPIVILAGSRRWLTRPLLWAGAVICVVAMAMLFAGLWHVSGYPVRP